MGERARLFFRAWRELVSGEYALQFALAETAFGRIYAAVFWHLREFLSEGEGSDTL